MRNLRRPFVFAVTPLLLLAFAGCGGGKSSSGSTSCSSCSSEPQILLSATQLSFSDVSINTSSAAQTVTVKNSGDATLTLSSITLSDTTNYSLTNGCSTTLAAGASCSLSLAFTPKTTGSHSATVTLVNNSQNIQNNQQQITLSGNGAAQASPQASLSLSSLAFASTLVGKSSTMTTVLSNTGTGALTLSNVAVSGSTVFTTANTCNGTVAAGSSCNLTVTFTPTAATSYSGTLTVTDNSGGVTGATQTASLSGSGTNTSAAITYNLYAMPDPGAGQPGGGFLTTAYALLDNAKSTIDLTMYAMQDSTFLAKLVSACGRGVTVRAVFDQNNEQTNNQTAFTTLNATANCSAVWANKAFQVTHEKSFIVDGTTLALMSLNLQSQYYSTTRDYAMLYNDPVDAAAVETTFNMDYAAGTTSSGVVGASDFSYIPDTATDLIWSPTTAKQSMLDIINNATTTLVVENEEMTTTVSYIISALTTACTRGVDVKVMIENEGGSYTNQLNQLKSGGCTNVRAYTSSTGFYVHAKAVVADYGLPTQSAYMGSINYSNASMTQNRELGMHITDQNSVSLIYNNFITDFAGATQY
ncbi:MAG: choice-of-anchor D domain-containing protein [Micavibrio sp.]|nr:choice-of-anchor D domain-containing protein [Micavibrio sp.]